MKFTYHSGIYTLESEQLLAANAEMVWYFFSNPANLEKLVPASIYLKVTSPHENHAYPGQIITYTLRPYPFIRLNWVTEITRVHTGYYFVDEQRFGPFSMWHHEHFFENVSGGVQMKDKVTFKMPFGLFGRLAFKLIVRKKLEAVFSYRTRTAQSILSK